MFWNRSRILLFASSIFNSTSSMISKPPFGIGEGLYFLYKQQTNNSDIPSSLLLKWLLTALLECVQRSHDRPTMTDHFQPLDLNVNGHAKEFLKNKFECWYTKQVTNQIDSGSNVYDVNVPCWSFQSSSWFTQNGYLVYTITLKIALLWYSKDLKRSLGDRATIGRPIRRPWLITFKYYEHWTTFSLFMLRTIKNTTIYFFRLLFTLWLAVNNQKKTKNFVRNFCPKFSEICPKVFSPKFFRRNFIRRNFWKLM